MALKKRALKFGDFMAENLQNLIERIQKEAVNKADEKSAAIIAKANEEASRILESAKAEAAAVLEKADKDSAAYAERSERAIQQAARDVLISVGRRIEKMISEILSREVEKNLSENTIKDMLLLLAKNYSTDTELVFSEADKAKLSSFAVGEFSKALGKGVKVESDSGIKFGFRVKVDNGKVSHEFTSDEIAASLASVVRPELAKIVSEAAQGK